jgi:hypothetical protein
VSRLLFAAVMAVTLWPSHAEALLIEDAPAEDVAAVLGGTARAILWVRDCGTSPRDRSCAKGSRQVSRDDSLRLEAWLSNAARRGRRYDEVWLWSGGGNSNEGFLLGRVFRKWQLAVRVPPGAFCASACTVAFMGGFFRWIDPGATYQVHSASAWLGGFDCPEDDARCAAALILAALKRDPVGEFVRQAGDALEDARYSAHRRLIHFQNALLQPLGESVPEGAERDLQLQSEARNMRAGTTYAASAQLARDVQRFRAEGPAAAQDILMRIERDSMTQALRELRERLPQLGRRADAALRMIEVMFQTSIKETSSLTSETLLRMGFVTRDVTAP